MLLQKSEIFSSEMTKNIEGLVFLKKKILFSGAYMINKLKPLCQMD